MLSFRLNPKGKVVEIVDTTFGRDSREFINRNQWKSFADVEKMAALANEFAGSDKYIPTDAGSNVSPRYDVCERPQVGDDCSYSFNGDSYPCGKIVRISAGPNYRRVETDEGTVFYRRGKTDGWKRKGGTFWMVKGIHNERNPSF